MTEALLSAIADTRHLDPISGGLLHLAPLIWASAIRHAKTRTALSAAIIGTAGSLLWSVLPLIAVT